VRVSFPQTRIANNRAGAEASSFDGEHYFVSLRIYYRVSDPRNEKSPYPYAYLDPVFSTSAGEETLILETTYTPRVDDALLGREMNKREKKKFGLGK